MEFLNIEYIFFMLPPAFVFLYFILGKKSEIKNIFDKEILEKLKFNNNTMGQRERNIFLFLALMFMIIALARPVGDKVKIKLNQISYDIVVGIDVSKSMLAKDVYPNRFRFAKEKFNQFVDNFKDANIGVIAFSQGAFLVSPITADSSTLKFLVNNLEIDSLNSAGTNIKSLIYISTKFLKKSSQKILVLFTDGELFEEDKNGNYSSKNYKKTIEQAKEYGLHIYIYGIGTKKGITIEDKNGGILKEKNGKIVITSLNENIKKLALSSNGAYIKASNSTKAINLLIKDIKSKFKKTKKELKSFTQYQEFFYYPLILSLIFLLIAFSSVPKRLPNEKFFTLLLLTIIYNTDSQALFLDFMDIDKANKAYENQDYKKAVRGFKQVAKTKESSESYYNLANSYYKNNEYDKAISNYKKVVPSDKEMEFNTLYNSANSYAKKKKSKEALKLYEKALKIKDDKDAKANRDLMKKILKKKKKQEEKDKKKKDKKKKKKKQDDKSKDKKQQEKNEKQKESNKKKGEKNEGDKSKQPSNEMPKENPYMSKKEEKKWDNLLKDSKSRTKPLKLKTMKGDSYNGKNW